MYPVIAFTSELKSINYWNPYKNILNSFDELKNLQFVEDKIYILGPTQKYDGKRWLWLFKFSINNNELFLTSYNENNNGNNIRIKIINDKGYIEWIEGEGTCLVKWCLQIFSGLQCKKAFLLDRAIKECEGRNTYDEIPMSLILKFKNGKTFYENFGFIPKNNNSNKNVFNKINNYYENLCNIQWEDIKSNNKQYIKFKNLYSIYYNNPFYAFEAFKSSNCNYFYDFLSFYLKDNNLPYHKELLEMKRLIGKKEWYLNLENIYNSC